MTTQNTTWTPEILEQTRRILDGQAVTETQPVSSCCSGSKQARCCEPAEKAACCGTPATSGTGCGCQ